MKRKKESELLQNASPELLLKVRKFLTDAENEDNNGGQEGDKDRPSKRKDRITEINGILAEQGQGG